MNRITARAVIWQLCPKAHKTYTQYGLCINTFIYKLNSRLYRIKAFTQIMPSVLLACKPNFIFTCHCQHFLHIYQLHYHCQPLSAFLHLCLSQNYFSQLPLRHRCHSHVLDLTKPTVDESLADLIL